MPSQYILVPFAEISFCGTRDERFFCFTKNYTAFYNDLFN